MTTKRLPEWFKKPKSKLVATRALETKLGEAIPNSICQEARCPNRSECYAKGVLTFMILGITCTRNCAFCSVTHGIPKAPNLNELTSILNAVEKLNLKFVVLTSPNRDDLADGGASHYAAIVSGIKEKFPHVKVEVLIPDFQGDEAAINTVIASNPDVINHNMETVPSLYSIARRGSLFDRSLDVLAYVKKTAPHILTKSGLMVGLGETTEELLSTIKIIKKSNVDILTIGQYLKPDKNNLDVAKYYHPDEFKELELAGLDCGFSYVFSGPLIRSSYFAEHVFDKTYNNVAHT
jgi:lipoic acid synthetase